MLVLNTNLYYDQNQQTTNMEDPAGQFSWADQILSQAATNEEKANSCIIIVGPPAAFILPFPYLLLFEFALKGP